MSRLDWAARQGSMGHHKHLRSDIVDEQTAEVASLGGAMDVTDGTTTVTGATTLQLPAGTVTDEGGGVAGVAVQTRFLGPFTVNYNTPGINTDPVLLTALDPGVVVVRAWCEVVTAWDVNADTAELVIGAGGSNWAGGDWRTCRAARIGVNITDTATAEFAVEGGHEFEDLTKQVVRTITAGALVAKVNFGAGSSEGQARVFALIAVPA